MQIISTNNYQIELFRNFLLFVTVLYGTVLRIYVIKFQVRSDKKVHCGAKSLKLKGQNDENP